MSAFTFLYRLELCSGGVLHKKDCFLSASQGAKASPLAILAFNLSAPRVAHWGEAHIEKRDVMQAQGFVNLGDFSWGKYLI